MARDFRRPERRQSFLLPPGDGFGHRLVVDVYPKSVAVRTAPAPPAGSPWPMWPRWLA